MRKFRFSMATIKLWFVLKLIKWLSKPYAKALLAKRQTPVTRTIRAAWRAL